MSMCQLKKIPAWQTRVKNHHSIKIKIPECHKKKQQSKEWRECKNKSKIKIVIICKHYFKHTQPS